MTYFKFHLIPQGRNRVILWRLGEVFQAFEEKLDTGASWPDWGEQVVEFGPRSPQDLREVGPRSG